jgi:hypothetical protein
MTSGVTRIIAGIWGRSATDVYAVGEEGLILHYNGGAWTAVATTWASTSTPRRRSR